MPSSTSSSETGLHRAVPRGNWAISCLIAAALALVATVVWELQVRAAGYAPSVNETSDLWAWQRGRVEDPATQWVIIGSSRAQFDLDLGTFAEHFRTPPPVQLAMPGSNPMLVLENVADRSIFAGTLVLGVTPALWFVPEGRPVENSRDAVGRYENWSPSQRVGLHLGLALQKRLAFWNPEDLNLRSLLDRIALSQRAGAIANIPPLLPPYFAGVDELRQARMWEKCDFGSPLALEIQRRWIKLFTPPPAPPHLSAEEFGQMMAQNVETQLERLRVAVDKVRARGGRVVFVRPPSSGTLREMENQMTPRAGFYDRMLEVTGAPGVHFEDHPELAGFSCPEWSHLTAQDAVAFTRALMPLLDEALTGN